MKLTLLTKLAKMASKQSPTILAIMGAVGAVTAVGLAIHATKKSCEEIDKEKESSNDFTMTREDVIKLVWKNFIPALLILVVSIFCIFGSNYVNLKRNALLAASYLAVNEKFEDYKTAAREVLGDKKEKEVQDKAAESRAKRSWDAGNHYIFETGHGNTLCYDDYSGRLFKCDLEYIRKKVNDVNYDLARQYQILVNEFYQELGLETAGCGRELGWSEGRPMDPVYSSFLTDFGEPCISIDITPNMHEI